MSDLPVPSLRPAAQALIQHLPAVLGHRGAPAAAPENTLAGLRAAHAQGARWVEFDVMLTADFRPVVFHDDTLDRTTDGAGPVAGQTLDMLGGYSAGSWFGPEFSSEMIPTLEEILDLLADLKMGANIEIKPDADRETATAEVVVDTVLGMWPEKLPPPLMGSFSRTAVETVRARSRDLPLALISSDLPKDWRDFALQYDLAAFSLNEARLKAGEIKAVKEAGFALLAWTVNDPARAVGLRAMGVDGLITDLPAQTLQALRGK